MKYLNYYIDENKFPKEDKIKSKVKSKKAIKEMAEKEKLAKQAAKDKPDNFTNMHAEVMKDKASAFKEGLKNVK